MNFKYKITVINKLGIFNSKALEDSEENFEDYKKLLKEK